MTKRILGVCLVLTIPAALLVGCGGSDSTADKTTTTTAAKSSQSPTDKESATPSTAASEGSSSSSSGSDMSVEEFCSKAKELASMARDVKESKDITKAPQMSKLAQELAPAAQALATKVAQDPSIAAKYEACAKEVADISKSN